MENVIPVASCTLVCTMFDYNCLITGYFFIAVVHLHILQCEQSQFTCVKWDVLL